VLLGIGFGGRMPLTTSIRGTYFGRRSYASITGVSMLPMNLLAFTIPLFAGHMADVTGSYNIPFITVAVLSSIGAVMFLMLEQPKQAPARSRASGAGGS
jgi:MFS family permease